MKLIIVESPRKCRTLGKFLGQEYWLESTLGHIRDLPKNKLGVAVEKDFAPTWVVVSGKKKAIKNIKQAAKKAEKIILATDPDREGEAIAWHTAQILARQGDTASLTSKVKSSETLEVSPAVGELARIVFHEITKEAIEKALKNPREIDMDLVEAQKARRILDRLVGYKLSPLLWRKVRGGLSAGRVQSVAVRLIVEREREREKFKKEEYWRIFAAFPFVAELVAKKGKKYAVRQRRSLFCGQHLIRKTTIADEKQAESIIRDLTAPFIVEQIEKKERFRHPPPPFTTSTLQQSAGRRFHWSGKMTMKIAQDLYERGLCVDENSLVITKEGEIYKIKELENLERMLIGIDEKTLKASFAEIGKFWKIKAPEKMITVETVDHEKLLITPDHPLMVMRNGYPSWMKGEDIQKGDYIAALEKVPVSRKKTPSNLIELIKYLPESIQKRIVFKFSLSFSPFIRRKKKKASVPCHVIERLWREKRMKREKIEKHYRGIKIKPSVGDSKFHQIPFYFNPKMAYLVGLITADGHLVRKKPKINLAIKTKDQSILDKLNKLLEEILGIRFDRFILGRNQVPINSTFLYYLVQQLGIPTGNKAARIDISNLLLSQPDEILKAYIAGLWDGDGCINKHPTANSIQVSYSSKSELFIDKLRLLLKTFGMNSSKHQDKRTKAFWLRLTSKGVPKFKENIVPYLIIRKKTWQELYQKYSDLYENQIISRCQRIPEIAPVLENLLLKKKFPKQKMSRLIGVDLFNYFGKIKPDHTRLSFIQKPILEKISNFIDTENQYFKNLSTSPIIWKEVVKSREINYKKPFVWDVTTSTGTFVVNGVVSHNCTYHRTDSTKLAKSAVTTIRKYIEKNFAPEYLPQTSRIYKTKSKVAQEAHEAIRPTDVKLEAGSSKLEKLGKNAVRLYDLIWRRTIASQMTSARLEKTNLDIACGDYQFEARGQRLLFKGFLKIYPLKIGENLLPSLKKGAQLSPVSLGMNKNKTRPPSRYTEAWLVKTLEREGIGRPSTYAPIISLIRQRHYVEKQAGRFRPTNLGRAVNDFLVEYFPGIVDLPFTAQMEEDLDEIARGKEDWQGVVGDFWDDFSPKLKRAAKAERQKIPVKKIGQKCPQCGGELVVRIGKFGKFIACRNFPKCKYTKPYLRKVKGLSCPKCGGDVIIKKTKKGKRFYGCSNWPKCDWASWRKPK